MSVFYKVPWKMKSRRLRSQKMLTNVGCNFGHPEAFVDNKTVPKMLKGEEFKRRVRAIVIDEAHLVLQWYLYVLFQKLF